VRPGPAAAGTGLRGYCLAIAIWSRSSGVIRWSRSSAAASRSIWTQFTSPVNSLLRGPVVLRHHRAALHADVAGVVGGEDHRRGSGHPALADPVAVQEQRDVAALAEPAAVIGELHPHLMLPGRYHPVALDVEALHAEQVVAVPGLPVLGVQAPAADAAALGDDDPLGAG
jgi:hypothetical protein